MSNPAVIITQNITYPAINLSKYALIKFSFGLKALVYNRIDF